MNTYNLKVNQDIKPRLDLDDFLKTIDSNVTVVCASKYANANSLVPLLESGLKDFGENRVDSFLEKYEALNKYDITWHFIGHLQTNKASKVLNKIDYLHSLDSVKLAKMIEKTRTKPLKCFIQVNICDEATKYGLKCSEIDDFISEISNYKMIDIVGVMMLGVKDDSYTNLKDAFTRLSKLKDELNMKYNLNMRYLSMGMSDDYKIAIECGATHIRLGRLLWR